MRFGPELVREDARTGRFIYVMALDRLEDWPEDLTLASPQFVVFIAADTRSLPTQVLGSLADAVLRHGAAYVCVWGPGAERLEDIFDEIVVGAGLEEREGVAVMTTSHEAESLEEALWFFSEVAFPALADQCTSWLAVTVGSDEWLGRTRALLAGEDLSA